MTRAASPWWLVLAFVLALPAVTPRIYASDEVQYFAYLRSLWFDGDVSFENDYRRFYDRGVAADAGFHETFLERTTETGRRINFATLGCALLWSPFYAVADGWVLATGGPRDGDSRPYVAAVAYGSAVYGFLALLVGHLLADNDPQKAVVVDYKRDYEERFKSDVSTFGGHAYDGLMIAVEAIKRAGSSDRAKVRQAVEGMEVVIHLGAYPNDADFIDVLLEPNVRGLYHICDAAREFGIERLVLSGTMQTVSGHGFPDRAIRIDEGPAPVNHYALTKVWSEDMGDMYARVYGLSVINVRIGWLPRNPGEADRLKAARIGPDTFFSHADAQRFYERCVESPTPGKGEAVTVFATSIPKYIERMELEPARRILGYEPQDVWPQGLNYDYQP